MRGLDKVAHARARWRKLFLLRACGTAYVAVVAVWIFVSIKSQLQLPGSPHQRSISTPITGTSDAAEEYQPGSEASAELSSKNEVAPNFQQALAVVKNTTVDDDSIAQRVSTVSSSAAGPAPPTCTTNANTEYWGDVVIWGHNHLYETSAECLEACRTYEPTIDVLEGAQCNTWVHNPTTKECWLKHQKDVEAGVRPSGQGPGVPWTSGLCLHQARPCVDCTLPEHFVGCISKTLCKTDRECGSPAVGAYAHVVPSCLESSSTGKLYIKLVEQGTRLDAYMVKGADYDGLGVHWGIGHKKDNPEACEQACRDHRPKPKGAGYDFYPPTDFHIRAMVALTCFPERLALE